MMFSTVTPERAGISSQSVIDFIDRLEQLGISTHSFLMMRGNDIFAEGYYAPFHKDFKHRMYSVSKSFVGVAIGLCEEEGLLSLDDKLVDYFPEYQNENTNDLLREQTIRDMLMMATARTGGVNWFASGTKDRCEVYFRTQNNKIPGTVFDYDSPGSFMLGVIVEKLTGKPFLEYLKEKFLIKAGFSADSYCLKCPGGHSFGDSAVMCTTRDLAAFARFVMNKGTIDGVRYMNEEYLTAATTKQISNNNSGFVEYMRYGYGYQIWIVKDGFAFNGMGSQYAVCLPGKDFIFVINSDTQGDALAMEKILSDALTNCIVNKLGEPLADDPDAYERLQKRISGLKLFSLKPSSSNFQKELDGRKYILDENPMGIKYVKFDFEGEKGILTYENAQGEKKLCFGMGYNEFQKFPQTGYADMTATCGVEGHMYDCAVSADWDEEKKLRIRVQIIDKYFGNMSMTFSFKDNRVAVLMVKTAEAFLDEYNGRALGKLAE
ncbi:MAG: serine hydrolase [Ruminococcaceae bacterium]|nr:serine hydrolase [Oscillospiraceae bacterium]